MASLAAAFAFWAWLDRGLWFFGDEWNFLVGRGLSYAPTNPQSIWYPHNEHWSTLPVLLWRGLYSVFHLGTYWPYIIPVLLAQVLVMHLAWRVSLRAGADIWVATAAVAVLGFLGAGAEDLAWGFQIGFVGSVLFGLLAFDLLDRRPRPGWRQLVLASVSLVASLMCSTIGDAMVVGAAVLAFARLPWRRALAVLALPIFSYALWFSGVGRLGLSAHSDRFTAWDIDGPAALHVGRFVVGPGPSIQPAAGRGGDPRGPDRLGPMEHAQNVAPATGFAGSVRGDGSFLLAGRPRAGHFHRHARRFPLRLRSHRVADARYCHIAQPPKSARHPFDGEPWPY